jgi:hypothetical protein
MQRYWPIVVLSAFAAASCGPKKAPEAAPKVGWIQNEGWKGSCYFPKDYANLGPGDRKLARQEALEEMVKQWRGTRSDGVQFDDNMIETLETVLLGRPEAIEGVSVQNAAKCEQFMSGATADTDAWQSYLHGLPGQLTAGECNNPLVDTVFNYLNINSGWQFKWPVCKDNRVEITGSEIDYYRITDKGPWINAAGDETQPTSSGDWPCNMEGCYAGMLIMRFTGESGITQIVPIGLSKTWTAPENGSIEVQINDTTFYDNKFKIESGLEHHTAITYKPG